MCETTPHHHTHASLLFLAMDDMQAPYASFNNPVNADSSSSLSFRPGRLSHPPWVTFWTCGEQDGPQNQPTRASARHQSPGTFGEKAFRVTPLHGHFIQPDTESTGCKLSILAVTREFSWPDPQPRRHETFPHWNTSHTHNFLLVCVKECSTCWCALSTLVRLVLLLYVDSTKSVLEVICCGLSEKPYQGRPDLQVRWEGCIPVPASRHRLRCNVAPLGKVLTGF
jgi:hypothetical protein